MSTLPERIAQLSPQQRALLQSRLLGHGDGARAPSAEPGVEQARLIRSGRPLSFSIFFFSDSGFQRENQAYWLVVEAARLADQYGFEAVWIPERHFHEFGGLYANPSVLAAAIAMVTSHIRIRAGSVVIPLHHPVRVAEEWAMVDNLSGGRVDISAASGWVREDFELSGVDFDRRREVTLERLETVRALWRGKAVNVRLGQDAEPLELRSFPRPVQPELDTWITTAGNPDTWVRAGALGHNVLSGLLQSNLDQTAANVARYREARAEAGYDPGSGRVTLMLHTFVGADQDEVRRIVQQPLTQYLQTHLNLYELLPSIRSGLPVEVHEFSADDKAALAEFAFERYFTDNGLFGTPDTGLAMTRRLQEIGVDEVACMIDFGVEDDLVLRHLSHLDELRRAVLTDAEALPNPQKTV